MASTNSTQITAKVKKKASEIGFSACGISPAINLIDEGPRLSYWLRHAFHGEMKYMELNLEKRLDPRLILENAKSVISLAYNYLPEKNIIPEKSYRIARFALGKDYHDAIKKNLHILGTYLKEIQPGCNYRAFVDSAPILERTHAVRSSLGWIGKNACLIIPKKGSWVILSEIITDAELSFDHPFEKDLCGNCTICINRCPTEAIVAPHVINATKCISYITQKPGIEVPDELRGKTEPWIYGCDICQEVCPHNQKAVPDKNNWLEHNTRLAQLSREDWEHMNPEKFNLLFEGTAIREIGYEGFMRNIERVGKNL